MAFAGIAGHAQFVNGSVQIIDMKGQQRILKKGQAVNEGDTLISAKGANAQIRMQDGGFVAVRPNTQLKFDSFKFSGKEDGSERAIFSLIKGGFRSVTGLIGRINKPNYRITTAVATIGIRGTDHETLVVTPDSSLAQAAPAGTYNKVNVGETYIATEKGTIFVLPNQMGYAGASDQMPELKPLDTELFTVANKPTKEAESEEADGEEVRETAAVDSMAAAAAAPESETVSAIAKDTQTDILQPITTTDGENLSGETIVETFAAYIPKNILISMSSINYSMGNYFVDPANISYTAGSPTSFTQVSFDSGWTESFTLLGASSPINGATISGATGIQFGRWTSVTGMEQSSTWQLDQQWAWTASNWMYGPEGYLDPNITAPNGQMYGTFNYVLDSSTAPFDWQTGQTGTLNSASLTVNFINSTLNANLGLTVGGVDWLASTSNASLFGADFNGNLAISMGASGTTPTLCSTCTGYLNGAFTGQNFAGAMMSYNLYDSSYTSDISGSVALVRDPAITIFNGAANPTGRYYVYSGSSGGTQLADSLTTSGGVLTSYGWGSASIPDSSYYSVSVSCVTCTSNPTTNAASTGIYYGSWDTGSITQTWGSNFTTFGPTWIAGPEAGPVFLANALVGSKTYSFDGGMVTNMSGVAGTVKNTTTLTVDFTRQVVGINLDLSVPDMTGASHNWNATTLPGNEAIIQGGQGIGGVDFYASSFNPAGAGMLTVTVDGATPGEGDLFGQLTGSGFNGAIMSYNLNAMIGTTSYEQVSGVAAFVGAASDTATPRRLVMASVTEPNLTATTAVHALGFYANSPTRMVTDASGNLTRFDTDSVTNNASGNTNGAMTLNSGTSTLSNVGRDALTGISWGRWDGGSMDVTDRATGGTPTQTPLAGSLHWIAGPTETAAVTLPVSGTYTYTNAGGTTPTDNLGNAGTLNNATLSANFTAQTVDIGVNVSVAGANMVGAAANVPIIQRTAFYADSTYPQTSTSHLAVTCTGTCGTSAQGAVLGGFTGAGATGAMMSYGFENVGPTSTQVISGVAAFRR